MSKQFYYFSSKSASAEGFTIFKNFDNNGRVEIHSEVDNSKNDFIDLFMLRRGLKQSSRVILDNCGVTERYIVNNIIARVKEGHKVDEVWMKIGKAIKLIYKKTEAKQ